MKDSFWTGNGKNAFTTKVVVSPTGHAVAKNYQADDLRTGDLGITLRLDRKLDGMTPEQRLAAQGLAEAMFKDLMKALGKEEVEGSGIAVGSLIQLGSYRNYEYFRVEKETRIGLHLRKLHDGFFGFCEFRTWDKLSGLTILPEKEARDMTRRAVAQQEQDERQAKAGG